MEGFRNIVLTGASRGIGRALAQQLAGPETRFCLIARTLKGLEETAKFCRSAGAEVEVFPLDVSDARSVSQVLLDFDTRFPIDVVIANAGVSAGLEPGRQPEAEGVSAHINAINFMGAVNTVEPLLAPMIGRKRGLIALVSSLAAVRPQPDMPSYSASKAGLRAYGIALRGALRPLGVDVSIICPGFVTSDMSARHNGFKPFEIDAEHAARIIARGIKRRRAHITFPWRLSALIWLSNRFPASASDWLIQGFKSKIDPEA
ncbi:MAG: SDR family NAD(P)-dependent oxidoreductase [Pseudomonadota bacterium]